MKFKEAFFPSFNEILAARKHNPSEYMWKSCLSINSQFCKAVVDNGYLTWEQMVNAACRYCLGETRSHGVIFWQIDQEGWIRDGKVMYYLPDCHRNKDKHFHPNWVSSMLCRRHHCNRPNNPRRCLFGLHLLQDIRPEGRERTESKERELSVPSIHSVPSIPSEAPRQPTVAIVEAEKTAFILSEKYPQYLWMASGGLSMMQPRLFQPLRHCRVTLFPDTDLDGTTYRRWYDVAQEVMASIVWEDCYPIRVSPFLEQHATPEQKARKIDLVDYLFEST